MSECSRERVQLNSALVNLPELAHALCSDPALLAALAPGVELECAVSGVCRVEGDAGRLRRALEHLLLNAA
eukprot:2879398-Rhodomonas_salina.1